jgi:hypothetical protein
MGTADEAWLAERARILKSTVEQLGLRIEGTYLEQLVTTLYAELDAVGIAFKPKVYLADEWACPDGVPVIGIPFYLADENLARLEDEIMDGIEARSEDKILAYLRHECGHAINYAYKLHETPEWRRVFGDYAAPYNDDFVPRPFSHAFVRHIPGYYAQKHPDEDFSETFAVWLTPGSRWREVYAGWAAYAKLEFVERVVREIGSRPPIVTGEDYDFAGDAIVHSLDEHYRRQRPSVVELPAELDHELREVFHGGPRPASQGARVLDAAELIARHRRTLVVNVAHWTGLYDVIVRSLVNHFVERCERLELWLLQAEENEALVRFTALVTALCMNRIHQGSFVLP